MYLHRYICPFLTFDGKRTAGASPRPTFRAIFNLSFRIIEGLAGEVGAGYGAFNM